MIRPLDLTWMKGAPYRDSVRGLEKNVLNGREKSR